MEQLSLGFLTVYHGPRLVDEDKVRACKTYRDACRLAWVERRRVNLTRRQLAQEARLYASHVTDYFSADPAKRELPAKAIDLVERALGNRAISQWHFLQLQRPDEEVLYQEAA